MTWHMRKRQRGAAERTAHTDNDIDNGFHFAHIFRFNSLWQFSTIWQRQISAFIFLYTNFLCQTTCMYYTSSIFFLLSLYSLPIFGKTCIAFSSRKISIPLPLFPFSNLEDRFEDRGEDSVSDGRQSRLSLCICLSSWCVFHMHILFCTIQSYGSGEKNKRYRS